MINEDRKHTFCVPKIRKAAKGTAKNGYFGDREQILINLRVAKKRYGNTSVGCNVMTVYTLEEIN